MAPPPNVPDSRGPDALPPEVIAPPEPSCLGVSACLLGERVRYDGDHCRDSYVTGHGQIM